MISHNSIRECATLALVFLACIFGIIPSVSSQSGTSSALTGVVMDSTHALVSGAAVMTKEVNTGAVRTGQSDANGRFLFAQVNPGTYQIEVTAPNFSRQQFSLHCCCRRPDRHG